MTRTVLLLGGTREARELASAWRFPDLRLVTSLAGVTSDPASYDSETRSGGFGGVDGLVDWLRGEHAVAIINATHPFAEAMSANAATAADRLMLPLLRLRRDEWPPEADWSMFDTMEELANSLPSNATVLLTTGRGNLAPFVARTDIRFILRSIEDPAQLPPHFTSILGRPPFTEASERSLMVEHGVTHLVTKNSGGDLPAKLAAASALGCETFCLSMPQPRGGQSVSSVQGALSWVAKSICTPPLT